MLNYEEIKKDLQRIAKSKAFINKYNWEGINFPSEKERSHNNDYIALKNG